MDTVWDSPVLRSVVPVVESSVHVSTSTGAVERVADWMAYEALPPPSGGPAGPFDWGGDVDVVIDATMVKTTLDFAFTDFESGVKFETEHLGRTWSDSEAMFACLHRAWTAGVPVLEGEYLASVTRSDLGGIFTGSIEIPMLDERVAILNDVGRRLVDGYGGAYHRFVGSCPPQMYAGGDGLLERLVTEFPRFADVSVIRGQEVRFYKLGQLALWSLHLSVGDRGGLAIADIDRMTAFADYIVPAALRVMGVLGYARDLEARIAAGVPIERDSEEEVEIRAHTLYATALLTDAMNARRPDRRWIVPEIDFRLWSAYHRTTWPHHLTRTVMY